MIHLEQIASREFVLLAAEQTVAEVMIGIKDESLSAVIVRRFRGQAVSHYLYSVREFIMRLEGADADSTLNVALDLEHALPTPTLDGYENAESTPPSCVVTHADEVIGYYNWASSPAMVTLPRARKNVAGETVVGRKLEESFGELELLEAEPQLGATRARSADTVSSPASSQPKDPPRSAYALLKCPGRVRPLKRFPVTIGLSETQVEGVFGEKLRRPDSSVGPYTLTVRLVHDGFRLDDAETSEVKLWVTAVDPYPHEELHLTPLEDEALNDNRAVMAQYYVDGQMIGAVARYIEVTAEAAATEDKAEKTTVAGCDMAVPTHKNAPDMTLTISSGNIAGGKRLLWSMSTIHTEIDERAPDDDDLTIDLGDSPCEWAKRLMNEVNKREGRIDLPGFLRGKGKEIKAKIPWWIRNRLVALSNHITDRAPTLLIVSTEPHVPWELAYMGVGDHGKDNFLAKEFVIGRWVLGICDENTVKPKPPLPPPQTVTVNDMFVISGDYSETKYYDRLEAAEKEAECLQARYHAQPVNATLEELVPWLETGVEAELIHFSVHGKYDAAGVKDGLKMVDENGDEMLDPSVVRGMTLKRNPFVFLNACQVGQSKEILGDYGGMAEAFLRADASGVIAPLWSVDDKTAKGIAERFYKGLEDGESPGELLLQERRRFKEKSKSGTFMAYLFFGHPRMRIIGVKSQVGEQCDE